MLVTKTTSNRLLYSILIYIWTIAFTTKCTLLASETKAKDILYLNFYSKGFGKEKGFVTLYEWDTNNQNINVALKEIFLQMKLPSVKGTEEIIEMHLSRALLLRNFRRQELLNYVKNLVDKQRPLMFIQMHEFAPSFFRTPEGWSLVGKSLFNIFEPLPFDIEVTMKNQINRLIIPWSDLYEHCILNQLATIDDVLTRAKHLLNMETGILYIIPPPANKDLLAIESMLLSNYSHIFQTVKKNTWDNSYDHSIPDFLIGPIDFSTELLGYEGSDYIRFNFESNITGYWHCKPSTCRSYAVLEFHNININTQMSLFLTNTTLFDEYNGIFHTTTKLYDAEFHKMRFRGHHDYDNIELIYIVNMKHDHKKLLQTKKLLLKLGKSFPGYKIKRFDAVHGVRVPMMPSIKHAFNTSFHHAHRNNPYEDHGWRRGVLGCAMSHLQIWNEIANNTNMNENNYYLIVEDDIRIRFNISTENNVNKYQNAFNNIYINAMNDKTWDILYYGFTQDIDVYNDEWVWPNAKRFSNTPRSQGGGTFAYGIRKKGALKLLNKVKQYHVHEPIDWFMIDTIGNGDVVAYKAIPHIFVQDKRFFKDDTNGETNEQAENIQPDLKKNEVTEFSSTSSEYVVEQHQLLIDIWKEKCTSLQNKDAGEETKKKRHVNNDTPNISFELYFIKPTRHDNVKSGSSKNMQIFVNVPPHFQVQLGLSLPSNTDEKTFKTFHKCSSLCWFLLHHDDFLSSLSPLATETNFVINQVSDLKNAFHCSPFLNHMENEFLHSVPYGKHALIAQMFDSNLQTIGPSIHTFIEVFAEVQPMFVLPHNGSVTSTSVEVQIELVTANGNDFLNEQQYAKLCFSLSGEFFDTEKFITCDALNKFANRLKLVKIDYGWIMAKAWVIGVTGKQIGLTGYQHFYVAAKPLNYEIKKFNEKEIWDQTIMSGKLFYNCMNHNTVNYSIGRRTIRPSNILIEEDFSKPFDDLTLLILVNRGGKAFQNALNSWDEHHLFRFVSETIIFFQYFNNTLNLEDDPRVQVLLGTKSFLEGRNLNKKRNLSAQRIKVIGSDDQVGIAKAFLSLVKYAKTEHVLFLEEDFTLENSKNTRSEIWKSLLLLRTNKVDLIKLRHRKSPGIPFCSFNVWHEKEDILKEMISESIYVDSFNNVLFSKEKNQPIKHDKSFKRLAVLNTMHWIEHPDVFYPNNVIWKCGGVENEDGFFCTHSIYSGWTNNPTMFKKDWFLNHFAKIAEKDFTGRLEAAINLTPQAWIWQCFVIGQGNGLFTHNDLDKPLIMQSPC